MKKLNNISTKILIVEDQFLIRKGLKNIIEQSTIKCKVLEADSMSKAIDMAHYYKPHLILMDLQLGDGTGAEASRVILQNQPNTKILFLSVYDNKTSVLAAMLSGANGYIIKNIEPDLLIQAINLSLNGLTVCNRKALRYLLDTSSAQEIINKNKKLIKLSNQQIRVLEHVTEGLTNKEIGKVMELSDKTIRNYLTIIFEKLGISKRTEAAVIFTESNFE